MIAKNGRTSIEMTEKFYVWHIRNTIDAVAVNVGKDRSDPGPPKRSADANRAKAG
jgi:hypothetical protein